MPSLRSEVSLEIKVWWGCAWKASRTGDLRLAASAVREREAVRATRHARAGAGEGEREVRR